MKRRTFLELAGGLAAAASAVALGVPVFRKLASGEAALDLERLLGARDPDYLDYKRARAVPTICFGCTTHCGVIGWVQDGRVRKIEGNPLDPNSRGKICAKANSMISVTYYPERLLHPLKRVGQRGEGKWKRISWDEALDEVAARMRATRDSGHPERFLFHYGRDKTKGFSKYFTTSYGTPNRLNRRSICSNNRRAPLMSFYGRDFEWETQDVQNTKYILNFGNNCFEAYQGGMYLMQRIQQARVDNGAKMVTFEVRPSATGSQSDEYWPVHPGSDGAIGFAMANVIIDEGLVDTEFWERWVNYPLADLKAHIAAWDCDYAAARSGVPAAEIERIALEFASHAPAATTLSARGSAKHYNGVQGDRGIRLLDVLIGGVGRKGGLGLTSGRGWSGKYGQEGLPRLSIKRYDRDAGAWVVSKLPKLMPHIEAGHSAAWADLTDDTRATVARLPEKFRKKYYGELATPSQWPLSWWWYGMKVGQTVHEYLREGRAKCEVYMAYVNGAAYGWPEAHRIREIMADETLVPFHVNIDIGYSEMTALADIALPEATALERWDPHSTNCYGLQPYTGLRQPLVEPLGEARSLQWILYNLAHRIGGEGEHDMRRHFDWGPDSTLENPAIEEFYKQWHSELATSRFDPDLDKGWAQLKRYGIYDTAWEGRPLDYEIYERAVPPGELENATVDEDTGIIRNAAGKAIGIMQGDEAVRGLPTPSRKIQVWDDYFPEAAKVVDLPPELAKTHGNPLPTSFDIPGVSELADDELVMTTFKWNVHTQGRSGQWKHSAEIVHTNPLFISPATAQRLGFEDGDWVEVQVKRPRYETFRGGVPELVNTFRNKLRFLPGVSDRVVCFAHSVGHFQHGYIARADEDAGIPEHDGDAALEPRERVWWSEANGGPGSGVKAMNDNLPINPSVLVGGQNWYDNVVTMARVDGPLPAGERRLGDV